jgi:hypothetical protein
MHFYGLVGLRRLRPMSALSGQRQGKFCFLGYDFVQSVERQPTFPRNISLSSSGSKNKPLKKHACEAGSK